MGHSIKPKVCQGCSIPKGWGSELIIENNDKYCGKILKFKGGCKFSMHYHMEKDETWYVNSGEFLYRWIDTENAEVHEQALVQGDVVRQLPGQPHQIEALTDGEIFEVSTTHRDSDSYRVWPGDSQTQTKL
jgi:mannose-6-phosphate isomerase-like protein (cupin superfamily)